MAIPNDEHLPEPPKDPSPPPPGPDGTGAGPLPSRHRPRRAWLAALLSFLVCGLGQVYCGRARRGLAFYLGTLGLVLPAILVVLMPVSNFTAYALVGLALVGCGLWLAVTVDAFLLARRVRGRFQPRRYNRFAAYVAWTIVTMLGNSVAGRLTKTLAIEIYRVPTRSECPTIIPGDRVLANKAAYRRHPPRRGDVIIFDHADPYGAPTTFIKRVVAVAGDTVEMRDNHLYINGHELERTKASENTLRRMGVRVSYECFEETNGDASYRIMLLLPNPEETGDDLWPGFPAPIPYSYSYATTNFPLATVPEGHCFVLGDNRMMSSDSRDFGPVALSQVRGRADYIIWPAGGWTRFGVLGR